MIGGGLLEMKGRPCGGIKTAVCSAALETEGLMDMDWMTTTIHIRDL
jgi:hypothetical protein